MHNDDDLDLLLNEALTTYAEPAIGLEQRILDHIEETGTESSPLKLHRWPGWAVVLPLAACILLFFAVPKRQTESNQVLKSQRPQQNSTTSTPTTPQQTLQQPSTHSHHKSQSVRLHTSSPSSVSIPVHKLEVFPTPQPLGPQEQALIELASPAALPARQALLETKRQDDAPLEISAIRVPPISAPEEGKN